MGPGTQAKKRAEEWAILTEAGLPYSGMLSELLRQNGIPFVTRDSMGAGMALKVGLGAERTRFYVPCGRLEQAKALTDDIFSEKPACEP